MAKWWNSLNGGLHYEYATSRDLVYHILNRYQHLTFYSCHLCDEGLNLLPKNATKQYSFSLGVMALFTSNHVAFRLCLKVPTCLEVCLPSAWFDV